MENTHISPKPSRATRQIPSRSRASLRGELVARLPADQNPRKIVFESKLEQRTLHLLLSRTDIYDIWDQPPAVRYFNHEGKLKTHVFDYLVTFSNRRRMAVAIKPEQLVQKRRFREQLMRIRLSVTSTFADDVCLITDRSFKLADAKNAECLHEFRRDNDPEADIEIAGVIAKMNGPAKIEELIAQTNLMYRGYRAIFRAIYAGHLRAIDDGEITETSRVEKVM